MPIMKQRKAGSWNDLFLYVDTVIWQNNIQTNFPFSPQGIDWKKYNLN